MMETLRARASAAFCRLSATARLQSNIYHPVLVLSIWAGLLTLAAIAELLPGDSAPMLAVSDINDKLMHLSAYAAVSFVPVFGLRIRSAVKCVLVTELVGIALDLAQTFVPERSCDLSDMLANTAGALAGIALALAIRSKIARTQSTF